MNSNGKSYSIKDLENFCGIKSHTIRMWEKRYGILTPCRTDTNIREYTEDELKKLIIVSLLNRKGLKISRIAHLNNSELLGEAIRLSQGATDKAFEERLSDIIIPALSFDEREFREILKKIIKNSGMEAGYIKVLYPLMQKARALWLTDRISRPQEQFIMNVIRSMIQNEELALKTPAEKETVPLIDLGNPEGINDLFFLKYLLRKRGYNVIFTEEKLVPGEIQNIFQVKPFQSLVINFPSTVPDEGVKLLCSTLIKDLHLNRLLILGRFSISPSLKTGKTEVICHPSFLTDWADNL